MPDLDLTGRRFGDYEILEMLGSGGMGKVYRALDVTLERVVALKMLAPNLSSDSAFVQRFVKEARAAARLNHPNIVQIYNFGTVESTYFLAMEYVKGHSLGYYLKHGHVFSESDGLQIVRQVGRALAVAHAEGLVHRDIKPDNLMLTSRGEVKIVDLGIAKRIDEDQSLTQSGTSIGTPHYISPEQIRGQKDIDARADIYSLGATLYHLVTGHTPFSGTSGPLVMSMHLVDPLPDPRKWVPDLSEGLCRVLRKMMAKKREERYPEMAFLDVDLHRLQAGQTPAPAEPSLSALETAALPGGRETVPTPRPAIFDDALLAKIEESLSQSIGPMARIIVRKTAKTSPSLEALCEELAGHLSPGPERDSFRSKCLTCGRTPPPAARPQTGSSRAPSGPESAPSPPPRAEARPLSQAAAGQATPAPGGPTPVPFSEAQLAALETELARQIGPLARVLVKKASRSVPTLSALVLKLEEQIPNGEGRRAFREAARKLAHGV
jgi:serine/threonine protein kinase